jgi:hypothetical protein
VKWPNVIRTNIKFSNGCAASSSADKVGRIRGGGRILHCDSRGLAMTPTDKARAKKLFAMLQSSYEAEVLTATRKLKELLAEYNMTINDLVAGNVDWDAPPPGNNQAGTQANASPSPPPPPPPPSIPQQHIELLVEYLAAGFERDCGINLRQNLIAMARLKQAAEGAIINLLSATATRIHLPYIVHGRSSAPMELTHWLTQIELQKLLTNPPPPPPPPQGSVPRSAPPSRSPLAKEDKVALGLITFFFVALPVLVGLTAMPEITGGIVLLVAGIAWAMWKFEKGKPQEGLVGVGVGIIGLVMLIDYHDRNSPPKPTIAYGTPENDPSHIRPEKSRVTLPKPAATTSPLNPVIASATKPNPPPPLISAAVAPSPKAIPPAELPVQPETPSALPWPQTTTPQSDPYQQGIRDYYSGHDGHMGMHPTVEEVQTEAARMVTNLIESTDNHAETRSIHYADTVNYYGQVKSRDAVLAEIRQFINRWPTRTYKVTSMTATCYGIETERNRCVISGTLSFQAKAPNRRSAGTATFEFTVRNDGGGRLEISTEDGKATRQISAK